MSVGLYWKEVCYGAQASYTITQLKAFVMTSDYGAFREGAAAYRNAVGWSKWQRDQVIERANNGKLLGKC